MMTDQEWKKKLTPEQYRISRLKGTEPPFTGAYLHNTEQGIYHCVCCEKPLFDSKDKYDSGSGWPSYTQPINPHVVKSENDHSHGMQRIEIKCHNCDAHLGHVFQDGPEPTGLRYCINSASLTFKKSGT